LASFGAEGQGKLRFFLLLRERRPGSRRGRTPGTGLQVAAAFLLWSRVAGSRVMEGRGKAARGRRRIKREGGRFLFWRRRVGYGSVREENW
jgi:hypothetical protein